MCERCFEMFHQRMKMTQQRVEVALGRRKVCEPLLRDVSPAYEEDSAVHCVSHAVQTGESWVLEDPCWGERGAAHTHLRYSGAHRGESRAHARRAAAQRDGSGANARRAGAREAGHRV